MQFFEQTEHARTSLICCVRGIFYSLRKLATQPRYRNLFRFTTSGCYWCCLVGASSCFAGILTQCVNQDCLVSALQCANVIFFIVNLSHCRQLVKQRIDSDVDRMMQSRSNSNRVLMARPRRHAKCETVQQVCTQAFCAPA